MKYLIFAISIAIFGSLLFGFHLAVIAGAILYIAKDFNLTIFEEGFLVSILILGAIFGSFFGGKIADFIGRKKTLIVTSFIFCLGTILAIQDIYFLVVLGRCIQGIGVGIVSVVVPLYIAEISPKKYRGALVSLNQFAIVLGVLIAYLVDYFFLDWKWMIGFSFIFTFIFMFGLFFIYETPSFLFSKKKDCLKAEEILKKLKIEKKDETIENISINNKKPLLVGAGISIIQQITGINVIIFFAPKIFHSLKFFDHSSAILIAIAVGLVQFVFTILAIFLIDKIGRKKLLLFGVLAMGFSMFFLAISFLFEENVFYKIFFIVSYVAFFAISLGPIAWLLIAEIFPLNVRGKFMGIAAFSNWTSNFLISLTFLPFLKILGASNIFFIFSAISFISFYFIKKTVPETKNKSFEEIQNFWK